MHSFVCLHKYMVEIWFVINFYSWKFNFWYRFNFFLIDVYNLAGMISFVFIEYYRLKFTWIHNHVVIFKPIYLTFWLRNVN